MNHVLPHETVFGLSSPHRSACASVKGDRLSHPDREYTGFLAICQSVDDGRERQAFPWFLYFVVCVNLLRMKRWAWISVIALVVIGLGAVWFWSLAAVAPESVKPVMLKVERGPVQVRSADGGSFQDARDGMTLAAGTTVKTGNGGRATIQFFGDAESRLDGDSELTISQADEDAATGRMNVQLSLGSGRMWSRVLRLFDLDSGFSVKTPSVVATVRGTAFDVRSSSDGTSEVWVSESAVGVTSPEEGAQIAPVSDESFHLVTSTPALAEGESALYGKDGKPVWRKPIPAEDRASSWFSDNHAADRVFTEQTRTGLRKDLDQQSGASGGMMGSLIAMSERMHVALANDAVRDHRAETYLARRLAAAIKQAESGRAGLASQMFSRIENEARSSLNGPDAARARRRLRMALDRVAPLLEDVAPSSSSYPFKQRMEDMMVGMQDEGASTLYARLLTVDARLDEADRLLDGASFEEARMALNAAESGLENIRRDTRPIFASFDDRRKAALSGKVLALLARLSVERARLASLMAPLAEIIVPTSTAPVLPVPPTGGTKPPSVTPTPNPTPNPTPTPSTATVSFSQITAVMQPNPISVGGSASIIVQGAKIGGGTTDLTSKSTFKIIRGAGTLSGARLTATAEGSITVEASYNDAGTVRTAQASLTVNQPVALSSLTVVATPSILKSGGSSTLSASATYSSGYTANVNGVIWDNLTPTLGAISGNTFTAAIRVYGTANIEGTYVENGVTKKASVTITIQ
jgi:hypothetical protein